MNMKQRFEQGTVNWLIRGALESRNGQYTTTQQLVELTKRPTKQVQSSLDFLQANNSVVLAEGLGWKLA